MPTVYLRKDLYDALIKHGVDPSRYINDKVQADVDAMKAIDDRNKKGDDSHEKT